MGIKGILAGTVTAAVMLAGCGEQHRSAEPQEVSADFSGTAVITMEGREYTADLRRSVTGVWQVSFTEPETVAGLVLTGDGEECLIELGQVQWTTDRASLPEYGAFPLLTESMEVLIAGKELSCQSQDGKVIETGVVKGSDLRAVFQDGELMTLEVEGCVLAEFC